MPYSLLEQYSYLELIEGTVLEGRYTPASAALRNRFDDALNLRVSLLLPHVETLEKIRETDAELYKLLRAVAEQTLEVWWPRAR